MIEQFGSIIVLLSEKTFTLLAEQKKIDNTQELKTSIIKRWF